MKRNKYRASKTYLCSNCDLDMTQFSRGYRAGFPPCPHCKSEDVTLFHSRGESHRWVELRRREKGGCINDLRRQVKFPIVIDGRPLNYSKGRSGPGRQVSYIADFVYCCGKHEIIEDFKGMDTPESKLKRALVSHIYGLEIAIIKDARA